VEMARPITRCLKKKLEENITNLVDTPTISKGLKGQPKNGANN